MLGGLPGGGDAMNVDKLEIRRGCAGWPAPVLVLLAVGIAVGWTSTARAGGLRTIACYAVERARQRPVIDGDLSDPAWAKAPISNLYYEYFKPNPGLGSLRTDLRMVYDSRGIYVAIVNQDQNIGHLRAHCVTRDDVNLWMDDCAELYFDPSAEAAGYRRFTTNSIGTRADLERTDMGILDSSWGGSGWRVTTKLRKDQWTVEAFFPWSDLGATAAAGSVWMFNHTRYAWGDGHFQGVTWAPGGNYQATDKFGYLCFVDSQQVDMEAVTRQLSEQIAPSWQMAAPGRVYVCRKAGDVKVFQPDALVRSAGERTAAALQRAQAAAIPAPDAKLDRELTALKQAYQELDQKGLASAEALRATARLSEMDGRIDDIYWSARLRALLEEGE
jgi:hypothetical protein